MIAGEFCAGLYIVLDVPSYNRKLKANNNIPVPEWRLPPVIIGGVLFGVGLIWFGFTGYTKSIHWIAPTLSGLFTGFGISEYGTKKKGNPYTDRRCSVYLPPVSQLPH